MKKQSVTITKKNSISSQDFIQNYQRVNVNYSSLIKFYTNNFQIIDELEKIINAYKESIITFQKKLINIKINIIKPFYNEEKNAYKLEDEIYSYYNNFIFILNQIINFQIDSLTSYINDLEKKIFPETEKKRYNDYMISMQQNKNNIQNNQKKMEKIYNEYNTEYKKFYGTFYSIEEEVQKYLVNKRKNKLQEESKDKLNNFYNEALNSEKNFIQIHKKFQENNKQFFDYYNEKKNEFKEETNRNEKDTKNNINSFIKLLIKAINSFLDSLYKFNKENNISLQNEKDIKEIKTKVMIKKEEAKKEEKASENFETLEKSYLLPIKSIYIKDKYKVRAINCRILGDYQSIEDKKVMNNLFSEMDLEEYVDTSTVIITEEEAFKTVNFFNDKFNFVDISGYNLDLEKQKIEIIKLTNKLLQPGLIKKNYDEYKDIEPINDEEVKKLEEFIQKGKEYRLCFLLKINYYRTIGIFDMPEREFKIIDNFFFEIIDILYKENGEDFDIIRLIIIMSQTFYFNKNGQKIYLTNKIKGHKLFKKIDFIKKYLNFCINEEFIKAGETSDKPINAKEKKRIVFPIILSFCNFMIEFDVPKENILEINESFYKEYDFDEDLINSINVLFTTK